MKIENGKFFKTWTNEDMRIMKDKTDKGFYTYKVQKLNGRTWDDVQSFHTLKEAKEMIK